MIGMVAHQPLERHGRAAAVVIGYDFCRVGKAADNSRSFPMVAQVFLDHDTNVEAAFLVFEQVNSFLDNVASILFLLNNFLVQLLERGKEHNLRIKLVAVAKGRCCRSLHTNDAVAEGTVYWFNVNHPVLAQHAMKATPAKQLGWRHVLA